MVSFIVCQRWRFWFTQPYFCSLRRAEKNISWETVECDRILEIVIIKIYVVRYIYIYIESVTWSL